jgi:hypothetical protein
MAGFSRISNQGITIILLTIICPGVYDLPVWDEKGVKRC